jgi:hypothetical protein
MSEQLPTRFTLLPARRSEEPMACGPARRELIALLNSYMIRSEAL